MSLHVQNAPMDQKLPSEVKPNVIPRFSSRRIALPDQFDEDTGLPKYATVEYVTFLIPGDKTSAPEKKVNAEIKRIFAAEYEAWKKTGDQSMEGGGLSLNNWPQIPKDVAAGLIHANVYTVEHLARLTDSQCQLKGTLGLRKYRDMAVAFLDASKAAAPIAALHSENEALKRRQALLEDQLAKANDQAQKLSDRLDQIQTATPSFGPPPQGEQTEELKHET